MIGGQQVAFKRLPPKKPSRQQVIGRCWHSHEEDEAETQAFRREGYDFPVSHGRWGIELFEDHTALVLDIAAADGVDELDGYWWTDDDRIHVGLGDPDRGDITLRIHSADEGILVVRRTGIDIEEQV